jgi:16S rRNA G966 N2-methylase RsmD
MDIINYNMINKIFPETKLKEILKYDKEGLWSITLPEDAENICILIKNELNKENITIFDGTGGIGGNTIAFGKIFNKVITIEKDKTRYEIIKNNIQVYELNNIELINGDCTDYLNKEADVYFYDPPWGGPAYKLNNKLRLKLGNKYLSELIKKDKLTIFKLPINYDLTEFKDNYKVIKIKNYLLIII